MTKGALKIDAVLLIAAASTSLDTLHTSSRLRYKHVGYKNILGEIFEPIR